MKYIKENNKLKKEKRILLRVFKDNDYINDFKNEVKRICQTQYYKKLGANWFIQFYDVGTLLNWFCYNSTSLEGYNRNKIYSNLLVEYKEICKGT